MRSGEGTEKLLPGSSCQRPWSGWRDPYIRNVEAEGSNPFTSTDKWVFGFERGAAPHWTTIEPRTLQFGLPA